jgi:hypothetical protein
MSRRAAARAFSGVNATRLVLANERIEMMRQFRFQFAVKPAPFRGRHS